MIVDNHYLWKLEGKGHFICEGGGERRPAVVERGEKEADLVAAGTVWLGWD